MSAQTETIGASGAVRSGERAKRTTLPGLLGWLAFAGLLVYIIFIGGGYSGILVPHLRIASLALIAAGMVVWALLALRWVAWRPRSAIWPALVVALGVLAVASLASRFPRLGFEYVAWAILLVALYLFLVRILSFEFSRARIGGLAAILGFVVGIAYLATAVARWLEWWELVGRVTAPMLRPAYAGLPFGGPTAVASVMILLTATAFAGLGFGDRYRRIVLGALSVMAVLVVFITGARTAWLASLVGLVIVGALVAMRHRERLRGLFRERRVKLGLAGLMVVAVGMAVVFAPALAARFDLSSDGGRTIYFTTAMRMFEASPLTGEGPGTWAARRLAYTQSGEPDIYVSHTHNIYSQTLAELGLLGVAAGLIGLLALAWLINGGLRDLDPSRRRYAFGALFVLLYFLMYGLLDSYVDLPLAYLLAALPFALLDGTSRRAIGDALLATGRVLPAIRRLAGIGLFLAAFMALGALFRVESIVLTHAQAVAAVERGDWAAASAAAAEAVSSDPDMLPYHLTRGIAAAGEEDWDIAASSFERAATASDQPEAWIDLALARLRVGDEPGAVVEALERGLRVGDQHGSVLLAAGYLYDQLGMTSKADELYVRLLASTPSVAADSSWMARLVGEERFGRVTDLALKEVVGPWELALMAGQPDRARALLASDGGYGHADDFISAWMGDVDAADRIRTLALASPQERVLAESASRVSAVQGDGAATARFRRMTQFGSEEVGIRGFEHRIRFVDVEAQPGAAVVVNTYALKGYRRATSGNALALGLPSLVVVDLAVRPADTQ